MTQINKTITAIGIPKLNHTLKENDINIVCEDIQYKEGIIEYLEKDKNIKYIIIDENLPGNLSIQELIFNIKEKNNKIKIILRTENKTIQVYKKIDKIDENEIIELIKEKNIYNKTYLPINNVFNNQTKEEKVITILGPNGIGKSIFSIILAKNIENKKILIIDFDILNNSLHTLLGVTQYSEIIQKNLKEEKQEINISNFKIENFIIKTRFNIDLISGINLLFNSKNQVSPSKIRNLINTIKKQYDYIMIDTSSECFLDYTKELIQISDKAIFISGANMLEIKKSTKLLEIYNKEWNIEKERFNIIFNKCTKQSIDDDILKSIFKNYKILGKIKLSDYYDLAINNNNSRTHQIKRDIKQIKEKIIKEKK